MAPSWKEAVSERRRVLQNPYAFSDEMAEFAALTAARKLSEDPYAHIEEREQYVLQPTESPKHPSRALRSSSVKNRKYSDAAIANLVKEVHAKIWKSRRAVFENADSMDPVDMLDPIVGLNLLGYQVELADAIGQLHVTGSPINAAGLIDNNTRRVMLSGAFSRSIQNFTAAHELGHAAMHDFVGMHRDKPLNGSSMNRDAVEREADKFASLFLMPEKLLRAEFSKRFLVSPFLMCEETEFALAGAIASSKHGPPKSLRGLSRILSSTSTFNGSSLIPLNVRFRVSVEAMAIRLEQLNLIHWA